MSWNGLPPAGGTSVWPERKDALDEPPLLRGVIAFPRGCEPHPGRPSDPRLGAAPQGPLRRLRPTTPPRVASGTGGQVGNALGAHPPSQGPSGLGGRNGPLAAVAEVSESPWHTRCAPGPSMRGAASTGAVGNPLAARGRRGRHLRGWRRSRGFEARVTPFGGDSPDAERRPPTGKTPVLQRPPRLIVGGRVRVGQDGKPRRASSAVVRQRIARATDSPTDEGPEVGSRIARRTARGHDTCGDARVGCRARGKLWRAWASERRCESRGRPAGVRIETR